MAQNKVTLSGKVIDQHGTPVAQATIAVENTTSGTYTNDQGKYSLQVAPGKHTFVVSFLGYQTVKQSLDIRQDKKQNFTLQESAVTLSSVEVYGKTQTQKVKEGAFAVNALDIKPIVNSLNNLNETHLVNRTTGIKVRGLRPFHQRLVRKFSPLLFGRNATGHQRKRCFTRQLTH